MGIPLSYGYLTNSSLLACSNRAKSTLDSVWTPTIPKGKAMLFLIHCLDKEGAQGLRAEHANAHAQYMRAHAAHVRVGGPLLSDDGTQRRGVLVLAEFEHAQQVQDFLDQEPYRRAGVFEQVSVHPFQMVMNAYAKE
jgi:uncharacterized protein YciI